MERSDLDDAWAAGLFDGEGCVAIRRSERPTPIYQLVVVVGQSGDSEPAVLTRLADIYGGRVRRGSTDARAGRRRRWDWTLVSDQAEQFLHRIAPYSVGKREQIRVALEYRETALGRGNGSRAHSYYLILREMKREVAVAAPTR